MDLQKKQKKMLNKSFPSHIINDVDHIKTIFRKETSKCRVARKEKYHTKKKLRIWVIIPVLGALLHAHRAKHDRNLNETCVSISGSNSNLFIKLKRLSFFFPLVGPLVFLVLPMLKKEIKRATRKYT